MRAGILCLVAFVAITSVAVARDITMKDGKVYKDVQVLTVKPSGIDIVFKKGDMDVVKHVALKNCTAAVQKEFSYDPAKAAAYEKRIKRQIEAAQKRHKEAVAASKAADKAKEEANQQLTSWIEAGKMNVILKVIKQEKNGCLAWACSPHASVTTGQFGQVFIIGMQGENGEEWAGLIYPTGMVEGDLRYYAQTLDLAFGYAKTAK